MIRGLRRFQTRAFSSQSVLPKDFKYTKTHEWVSIKNQIATVGITDHAQAELGDIVHIDPIDPIDPIDQEELNQVVNQGDTIAIIESVKAASDIHSPVSGKLLESNTNLSEDPGIVNTDPYETGWIVKIQIDEKSEIEKLLSSDEYEDTIMS